MGPPDVEQLPFSSLLHSLGGMVQNYLFFPLVSFQKVVHIQQVVTIVIIYNIIQYPRGSKNAFHPSQNLLSATHDLLQNCFCLELTDFLHPRQLAVLFNNGTLGQSSID